MWSIVTAAASFPSRSSVAASRKIGRRHTTGVNAPKQSTPETAKIANAFNEYAEISPPGNADMSSRPATENLKTRRAKPAMPLGNIEKSRCTIRL